MIAIAWTAHRKFHPCASADCSTEPNVVGPTRSLSMESALTWIAVKAICPCVVETPMLERSADDIVEKTGKSKGESLETPCAGKRQDHYIQADGQAGAVQLACANATRPVNGFATSVSGGEI